MYFGGSFSMRTKNLKMAIASAGDSTFELSKKSLFNMDCLGSCGFIQKKECT